MPGFDDIKSKGLISNRGEQLLRGRQEKMQQKSVEEVRVLERVQQDMSKIDELTANINEDFNSKLEQITSLSARVEELKKVSQRIERGRQHGATKQFVSGVSTALGARTTREDISAVSRSAGTFGTSLREAEQYGTTELEARIGKGQRLLSKQTGRITETAAAIDQPGMGAQFRTQMGARQRIVEDVGTAEAALRTQKRLGLDIQSKYMRASEVTGRVQGEQQRYQIAQDVAAGRTGSRQDVQEKLQRVSEQLIDTFKQLDEAVKNNASNTDDLSKQFDSLNDEYQEQQQILREMGRQGGGSGLRRAAEAGGMIGDTGVMVQGAGQMYGYNYVQSEMAQMEQRTGMAQRANLRFTDRYQATQGDMSALRRVLAQSFEAEAGRGREFGERERAREITELTGKGIQTAGGLVQGVSGNLADIGMGAATGMVTGGPAGAAAMGTASAVTSAGAQATADVVQSNRMFTDLRKQINQAQVRRQSAQQMRELQDTISQIDDFTAQRTADYTKNVTMGTRGLGVGRVPENYFETRTLRGSGLIGGERARASERMDDVAAESARGMIGPDGYPVAPQSARNWVMGGSGAPLEASRMTTDIMRGGGRRESLQQRLLDPDVRRRLGDAGLTGEQISQLAGEGVSAIGANMAGRGGTEAIERAGLRAQAGYFRAPEQYMQARGQLTGVGGRAEDLEKIMREAVAAGMDNSKNIMEMVSATQAVASSSAAAGIDVAGGAATMVGRTVQGLRAQGVRRNMATTAAQNAITTTEQFTRGRGQNISSVLEFSRLRESFPEADITQLSAMQATSGQELQELMEAQETGDTNRANELATQLGLKDVLGKEGSAQKLFNIKGAKVSERLFGVGVAEEERRRFMREREQMGTGLRKRFSPEMENVLNRMTRMQGMTNVSGLGVGYAAAGGPAEEDELLKPGERAAGPVREEFRRGFGREFLGGTVGGGEKQVRAGARSDAELFAEGVGKFEEAVGGLEGLGEAMDALAKMDPENFAEATREAAQNLKSPMTTFSKNLDEFNGNMNKILERLEKLLKNNGGAGGPQDNQSISDAINKFFDF